MLNTWPHMTLDLVFCTYEHLVIPLKDVECAAQTFCGIALSSIKNPKILILI